MCAWLVIVDVDAGRIYCTPQQAGENKTHGVKSFLLALYKLAPEKNSSSLSQIANAESMNPTSIMMATLAEGYATLGSSG